MAISLRQTGRDESSVTFYISGITTNRSTYVWCTDAKQWMTLQDAKSAGHIRNFSVSGGDTGSIRVIGNGTDELKVWQFVVLDVTDEGYEISRSGVLNAVLGFEYDNAATKLPGATMDIDITVRDLRQINLFGSYINGWIIGGDGYCYYLDQSAPGTDIFAEFLITPAQNIYDTAAALSSSELPNRSDIMNRTRNIINNVSAGADFKAEYFNNIKEAINSFNMSV